MLKDLTYLELREAIETESNMVGLRVSGKTILFHKSYVFKEMQSRV